PDLPWAPHEHGAGGWQRGPASQSKVARLSNPAAAEKAISASASSGKRQRRSEGSWRNKSAPRSAPTANVRGLNCEMVDRKGGICRLGTKAVLVNSRGMFTTCTKTAMPSGARVNSAMMQERDAKANPKRARA